MAIFTAMAWYTAGFISCLFLVTVYAALVAASDADECIERFATGGGEGKAGE